MAFRFEKLEIWKLARQITVQIYKATSTFPSIEKYSLTDQIRRACISIALNIAEGADRGSDKEFVRFLHIALGSVDEVVTGLFVASDLGYIDKESFNDLYIELEKIAKMIRILIKALKKQ